MTLMAMIAMTASLALAQPATTQPAPATTPTVSAAPATTPVVTAPAPTAPPKVVGMPDGAQTTTTPGSGTVAPTSQPLPAPAAGGLSSMFPLLMITVLFVFMIFMSMMTGRKERKRRAEMISALSTNDRVRMLGGIIGTIAEIKDDEVVVRVDESTNTRIRFAKSAVDQVIRKNGPSTPGGKGAGEIAEAKLSPQRV